MEWKNREYTKRRLGQ